jgi:hypothetical protein
LTPQAPSVNCAAFRGNDFGHKTAGRRQLNSFMSQRFAEVDGVSLSVIIPLLSAPRVQIAL